MKAYHIYGNTWYFKTALALIPFYIFDDGTAVVMDSGAEHDGDIVLALKGLGLKVNAVLLTHMHFDHTGAASLLKQSFGARIYAPPASFGNIVPTLDGSDSKDGVPKSLMKTYKSNKCIPDTVITADMDSVCIGKTRFRVIQCPGHTDRHLAFVTPDDVCYLGDLMTSDGFIKASKLLYAKDYGSDRRSKRKIRDMKFRYCIAAHRSVIEGSALPELADENIAYMEHAAETMLDAVEGTTEEKDFIKRICDRFDFRPDDEADYYIDICTVRSYIRNLVAEGSLVRAESGGRVLYSRGKRVSDGSDTHNAEKTRFCLCRA